MRSPGGIRNAPTSVASAPTFRANPIQPAYGRSPADCRNPLSASRSPPRSVSAGAPVLGDRTRSRSRPGRGLTVGSRLESDTLPVVDSRTWFRSPEGFSDMRGASVDVSVDADGVPDIAAVVELVQGLLIYDVVAKPLYDVDLSAEFADAIHVRHTHELLDLLGGCTPRPAAERAGRGVARTRCSPWRFSAPPMSRRVFVAGSAPTSIRDGSRTIG